MQPTIDSLDFLRGNQLLKSIPVENKAKPEKVVDKWQIPDEATLARCQAEAQRLKKNHPDWTSDKLARKVAETFKLKKLPEILSQQPAQ